MSFTRETLTHLWSKITGLVGTVKSDVAINKTSIGLSKKNLFNTVQRTETVRGITFTGNSDKTIKLTGINTETSTNSVCYIGYVKLYKGESYIISGGINSNMSIKLQKSGDDTSTIAYIGNTPYIYTPTEDINVKLSCWVKAGTDCSDGDYVIKPMIRYADIIDDSYEPYTPSLQEQISQNTSTISQLEIGGVYLYNKISYSTFDEGYVMRVGNQIHINCKITMTKKIDAWVSIIDLPFAVKTPGDSNRYIMKQTQLDGRTTPVYIDKGGPKVYSSTVLEIGDVIKIKGLILDMYVEETATVTE